MKAERERESVSASSDCRNDASSLCTQHQICILHTAGGGRTDPLVRRKETEHHAVCAISAFGRNYARGVTD